MISLLNDNIKTNEIDLFKLILNKFILDEKYKSPKIKKAFLYLAKVIISNKKIKDFIHNENFLNFLSNNINDSNNIMEIITNQANKIFNLNLVQRFSIEILIVYLLKTEKEDLFLKTFAEKLIVTLNTEYNSNNLFHYNNLIFKQIFQTPSAKNLIFDKNNMQSLIDIFNFINIQNNSTLILTANPDKNTSLILFDLIYPKFHLIKLYKTFLKIFFEKKFSQTLFIINMVKDLIQNQLALYSSASTSGKSAIAAKSDALTKSEETKDDLVKNLPLLSISNLDKTLHVNLKTFLIKSLTNCLKITLFNISKISQSNNNSSNNSNLNNSSRYLEFLNLFISIAMVLILSEECWDIKVNGVNLLIEIIKRFSKIKDDRVDDNSLLIQQYEAQISSCIKMIFGNNFSIESLFKGMDLLYCYVCIPITTDYSYVKKIESFIDIDLHKNNPGTIFSEKYDHFFITKKLKFFCRLYMTSLSKPKKSNINSNTGMNNINNNDNLKSICVFNSDVSELEIYGENLETTKFISEYFDMNLGKLFKNLFDMLSDLNIILNSDPKFAKNYKNYEFLASGNRIAYSYKKVHKYSQIYLKILSIILLDKRAKDDKFLENLSIKNVKNIKIKEIDFDSICEILLYHINHFSTKNSQNMELNMVCISDFNIYSDNDITFELKEKLILNSIKIIEMFEILYQVLLSQVKISKKILIKILNYCFFLVNFSIKEFDEKIFFIVEIVIKNLIEKNQQINKTDKDKNSYIENEKEEININNEIDFNLTNEEKHYLMQNLTKFCFNYFSKNESNDSKSFFAEKNSTFLFKLIEIVSSTSNLILIEINSSDLKNLESSNFKSKENESDFSNLIQANLYSESAMLNDFLVLCKIQFGLFKNAASQLICKTSAAKLFGLLSSFKNLKILKLFYDLLFENLNTLNLFDRYFILYYMLLQNISKRYANNNILQEELKKIKTSTSINSEDYVNNNNYKDLIDMENELSINNQMIDFTNFILIKDFKSKINSEKISQAEKNSETKEKIYLLIKSLCFACNSNFDDIFKSLFENVLFYSLEIPTVFLSLLPNEEFLTLLLTFTITIENDEKRKNLILILLFLLNEKSINSPNDMNKLALISLKLISKDIELISGIAPLLDRNFLMQINNFAIMQRNQVQNQSQQQPIVNSSQTIKNENVSLSSNNIDQSEIDKNNQDAFNEKIDNDNNNANEEIQGEKKTGGPKLKALKFGK